MLPSFPGDSHSKESACNGGDGFDPWVRKIPWRREWLPIPVFLPREFHGQKSLVGYRPWGCKESDTTEQLKHHMSFYMGLEYPRIWAFMRDLGT